MFQRERREMFIQHAEADGVVVAVDQDRVQRPHMALLATCPKQ